MRPFGSSDRQDSWHVVVEALEQVQVLRDPASRGLCLDLLTHRLGFSLQVKDFPSTRQHLFSILLACRQYPEALPAFLRVLDELEPGSLAVRHAHRLLTDMATADLVSGHERRRLVDLVSRSGFPHFAELSRAAAGPAAAELPIGDQELEEALVYLEELNARSDGIPPLLVFVEYLAHQVGGALADQLREWSDLQAGRMGVTEQMAGLRAEAMTAMATGETGKTVAHLVIRLERDTLDRERFLMEHWRQADPKGWYPRRGSSFAGALPEIERAVAELVEEAEGTWARNAVAVRVEFMLPLELLNLPVDQWLVDTDSAIPRPLGLLYQVTLRSLERARTRKWHREWRRRWSRMWNGSGAECLSHWCSMTQPRNLRRLEGELAGEQAIVSLVFRSAPAAVRAADASEMLVGLRNGIPVMVWQRAGAPRTFESTMRPILDDIGELPEQTRLLRGRAYQSSKPLGHVGSRVTLMWDDPDRLVEPVDLPSAPAIEEVPSP
ncbi:MAG: hypothetical protein ABW215_06365 [Kibdelosporangium sp.]